MAAEKLSFEERLHGAMFNAYEYGSMQQMLQFKLSQRLDHVTPVGVNVRVVVFELLPWAKREGRAGELLDGVVAGLRDRRPTPVG
jgi:hypothetical protein